MFEERYLTIKQRILRHRSFNPTPNGPKDQEVLKVMNKKRKSRNYQLIFSF